MTDNYKAQIKLSTVMMLFFTGTFLIGTFCDKTVAEALFSPDITLAKILTTIGVYPYFGAQFLFMGALLQRIIYCKKSASFKAALGAVCILTAVFMGYIGGRTLVSRNNLGNIFPSFIGYVPVIAVISMILFYPLLFIGYSAAKKTDEALLAKRVLALFFILLTGYITSLIFTIPTLLCYNSE